MGSEGEKLRLHDAPLPLTKRSRLTISSLTSHLCTRSPVAISMPGLSSGTCKASGPRWELTFSGLGSKQCAPALAGRSPRELLCSLVLEYRVCRSLTWNGELSALSSESVRSLTGE